MAITKQFKSGNPADDAEIVTIATNQGKMDDNVAATSACGVFRIETTSEHTEFFDAKRAITYSSGTWEVIHDEIRGDQDTSVALKIVVASASGSELRVIHDFGIVTITAAGADQSFQTTTVAPQTLTTSERLAVFFQHDGAGGERMETGIENFDTTCNSRLLTPDEEVAGAPLASLFERRRIIRTPLVVRH